MNFTFKKTSLATGKLNRGCKKTQFFCSDKENREVNPVGLTSGLTQYERKNCRKNRFVFGSLMLNRLYKKSKYEVTQISTELGDLLVDFFYSPIFFSKNGKLYVEIVIY